MSNNKLSHYDTKLGFLPWKFIAENRLKILMNDFRMGRISNFTHFSLELRMEGQKPHTVCLNIYSLNSKSHKGVEWVQFYMHDGNWLIQVLDTIHILLQQTKTDK